MREPLDLAKSTGNRQERTDLDAVLTNGFGAELASDQLPGYRELGAFIVDGDG